VGERKKDWWHFRPSPIAISETHLKIGSASFELSRTIKTDGGIDVAFDRSSIAWANQ